MNIWYLLKCWFKILIIVRRNKTTYYEIANVLRDISNQPYTLFFNDINRLANHTFYAWYALLISVGMLSLLLGTMPAILHYNFDLLAQFLTYSSINWFFITILLLIENKHNFVYYLTLKIYMIISLIVISLAFILIPFLLVIPFGIAFLFLKLFNDELKNTVDVYSMYNLLSLLLGYDKIYVRIYESKEEIDSFLTLETLLSNDDHYNRQLYSLYINNIDGLKLIDKTVVLQLLRPTSFAIQKELYADLPDAIYSLLLYDTKYSTFAYVVFFEKQVDYSMKLINYPIK